ncbi:hypothetical protein AB4Y64_08365 [Lysobacter sp. TAF61]|uniref:beta family protein n=1 Tax=Lysobacter sp. TAF61 TaxID=3233072 RepID=UPI003F97DB36
MTASRGLYLPIIRTRSAELRGLKELRGEALDVILPVVELTRSRRTAKNPLGALSITVGTVADILGLRPFVADLTSLEGQQNSEFTKLLDPSDGFASWVEFVKNVLPSTAIPVVHLTDPFDADEYCKQVRKLLVTHGTLALRIPTSYAALNSVVEAHKAFIGGLDALILLVDASYVMERDISGALARVREMLEGLGADLDSFAMRAVAASSFPSSVMSAGGGDSQGQFHLSEVELSTRLQREFPRHGIRHSDYGSIHPLQFGGVVTQWVPRVDVPLDLDVFYHRYRRDDGGYVRAAAEALSDPRYVELDCWAHENIVAAANGLPLGRSPAYWISVRVNYHVSRQATRLSRESDLEASVS